MSPPGIARCASASFIAFTVFLGAAGCVAGKNSPSAIDSIDGYRRSLNEHPEDQQSGVYRNRVAALETTALRQLLVPKVREGAPLYSEPQGQVVARHQGLAPLVMEGYRDGWYAVRAVGDIAGNSSLFLGIDPGAKVRTSPPTLTVSSFVLHGRLNSGFSICVFAQDEFCERGYAFEYLPTPGGYPSPYYDFNLVVRTDGNKKVLCSFPLLPPNNRFSVAAHDGYLVVADEVYPAQPEIKCVAQDTTYRSGRFGGFNHSGPDDLPTKLVLTAPSDTVFYVEGSELIGVDLAKSDIPGDKDGAEYADFNTLAHDLRLFAEARHARDYSRGGFNHAFFAALLAIDAGHDAFAAVKLKTDIGAFAEFVASQPNSADRAEAERLAFQMATKDGGEAKLDQFVRGFPFSRYLIEARKQLGDIQWAKTVAKNTPVEWNAYLKAYPTGFYVELAKALLGNLKYREVNQTGVAKAEEVRKAAQQVLSKSREIMDYSPVVVDFDDGVLWLFLTLGFKYENPDAGEIYAANGLAKKACSIAMERVPNVKTCKGTWIDLDGSFRRSLEVDIPFAIEFFYLKAMRKGVEVDVQRLIELLRQLEQHKEKEDVRKFLAKAYSALKMKDIALYWNPDLAADQRYEACLLACHDGMCKIRCKREPPVLPVTVPAGQATRPMTEAAPLPKATTAAADTKPASLPLSEASAAQKAREPLPIDVRTPAGAQPVAQATPVEVETKSAPVPSSEAPSVQKEQGGRSAKGVGDLIVFVKPKDSSQLDITNPSGSRLKSRSPYKNPRAASGTWRVVAKATGYEAQTQEFIVVPDDVTTIKLELRQVGGIRVLGKPPGAAVDVEGPGGFSSEGGVPWELSGLAPGEYRVQVTRRGYVAITHTLTVGPGQVERLEVDLKKDSAGARKESTPAGGVEPTNAAPRILLAPDAKPPGEVPSQSSEAAVNGTNLANIIPETQAPTQMPETPEAGVPVHRVRRPMHPTPAEFDEAMRLYAAGNFTEAIPAFERVLVDDPTRAEIHMYLGSLYASQGDIAKGAWHYEDFVHLRPADKQTPAVIGILNAYFKASGTKPRWPLPAE